MQAILLHHSVNNLQIVCCFLDPAGLVGVDRSLGNLQRIHVCEVCTHLSGELSCNVYHLIANTLSPVSMFCNWVIEPANREKLVSIQQFPRRLDCEIHEMRFPAMF